MTKRQSGDLRIDGSVDVRICTCISYIHVHVYDIYMYMYMIHTCSAGNAMSQQEWINSQINILQLMQNSCVNDMRASTRHAHWDKLGRSCLSKIKQTYYRLSNRTLSLHVLEYTYRFDFTVVSQTIHATEK